MASASGTPVLRMRTELDRSSLHAPRWPAGVRSRSFLPADAADLHALLVHAYQHGGGSVAEFSTWLTQMTGDEEYDPALWILAETPDGPVGAVLCWTSGFVKDLVVSESWRGHGVGEALLRCAFAAFAARGLGVVELKVHADNASAIRLYERVGMRVVERIASS